MSGASARVPETDEVIPLISLCDLGSKDINRVTRLADTIGQAAREVGFFRVCDHGIDAATIKATYAAARTFFARPEIEKRRLYIGLSANHRGYVPFTEKGDYPDEVSRNYEAFDLGLDLPEDDPDYCVGNRMLGPNVWPDQPGFRDVISVYYAQVADLGQRLCALLELHLGLPPESMTSRMSKPISQLRLLHYVRDRQVASSKSVNMGAHTDYECLTLLHTGNPGLQVMTRDDRWIDVPVDPSALVVNIGDMMEAWTNGLLRSTPHRVLNLSPERFSLPYFTATNHDTVIAPFPELVEPGHPPRYAPFTAGAHLERMLVRDFPYLRNRVRRGDPEDAVTNPFEDRLNRSDD